MTPPPRTPFSKEPATERAAAPLGTMATPATAGRRGAKVHQTGDERPPTASHPPPRTASQGQMRGSNSCPPGRGLRAAVTLVHTSRNTRALWVSSLCHLGHSLCTHVQVHVHTAEAPRAPDLSERRTGHSTSPSAEGKRLTHSPHPHFDSCSYSLRKGPNGIKNQ